MAITQQRLTLEEFLKRPERKPALEFEDGVVTQKVAPKGRHGRLQYKLAEWVNRFAEPRRLAVAIPELRTTFGGASRVPDVAVYRWERIPRQAGGKIANDFLEPPDIAIEIVSPKQSVPALVQRCRRLVAQGVPLVLLVNPEDETVLHFHSDGSISTLRGTDEIDFAPIIPGLKLVVQDMFGWLSE